MRAKVKKLRWLTVLAFGLFFAAIAMGVSCGGSQGQSAREQSVDFRYQNFARAEQIHPLPAQQNFPLRELLAEYTRRQDLINHQWYIYILGENLNVGMYFVSTTMPLNACAFLSSTEEVYGSSYGNLVLTAPSLDGIYYGGSGASAVCTGWIVKDAATNAMGIIYGDKLLVFDQPLIFEAEPVRIQIAPEKK
jgi:hypothetical protein